MKKREVTANLAISLVERARRRDPIQVPRPAQPPVPFLRFSSPFLKGPIAGDRIAELSRRSRRAILIGLVLRYLDGRYRRHRAGGKELAELAGLGRNRASEAIAELEDAGLIKVERRAGAKNRWELVGPTTSDRFPPLRGPIPLHWLRRAGSLHRSALLAGVAVWHEQGRARAWSFPLNQSGFGAIGLDRYAASRGLDALADLGLIDLDRKARRPPTVRLLSIEEPPQPEGRLARTERRPTSGS